jgi:hypothetical protein
MLKFFVGQNVTCIHRGYGVVNAVHEPGVPEPVFVTFERGHTATFTLDGKSQKSDFLPSLFVGHISASDFEPVMSAMQRPDPATLVPDQLLHVYVNGAYVLRHFAKYEAGRVFVWPNGATSYTAPPGASGAVVANWRIPTSKELQLAQQR